MAIRAAMVKGSDLVSFVIVSVVAEESSPRASLSVVHLRQKESWTRRNRRADEIRDELSRANIVLKDEPTGTTWSVK